MTPRAASDREAFRVAICGAGMRGRSVWMPLVSEADDLALVGVHDPSPESRAKAEATGLIPRERLFADLDKLLDTTHPDALIVCPPHQFHAWAALRALERDCHVLVEKPFVTDLADGIRIVDEGARRGRTVAVVQNWRPKSVGEAMKRAIDAGKIGAVSHVFFRYIRDRELPTLPEYLFDESFPMIYALTVHHFDLLRYLFDCELLSVDARSFRPSWSRYRSDSGCHMWLRMANGVVVSYVGTVSSRASYYLWENWIIEGERGSLINESRSLEPPLLLSTRGEAATDLTAAVTARDAQSQYRLADVAILRNFVATLRGAVSPLVSARDNLGTVAAVTAAIESLQSGREVEVRVPKL